MCNGNSIDKIISYIAGYDSSGKSTSEIDTEKEYKFLGAYLNGSVNIYNEDDEEGNPIIIKYTDLFKEGKEQLFAIMDNLRGRFGEWKNTFTPENKVTDNDAFLYADRLYGFKTKLEELKNCDEEQYQRYYADNKEEMELVESKLREYCEQAGLVMSDYEIKNLEKLLNTCDPRFELYYRDNDVLEFKDLLGNSGNDFVITDDLAQQYKNAIRHFLKERISILTDDQMHNLKTAVVDYLAIYLSDDIEELNGKDKLVEIISTYNINHCFDEAFRLNKKINHMEVCNKKVQQSLTISHNDELKAVVDKYIQDNGIGPLQDIPDGVDMGDGGIYKKAIQEIKTNTCWAYGEINSLLPAEAGAGLINNNYYRDENTGVFAIHLQEAEDLGLHGGEYIVTPQDIIDSQDTYGRGNGIISAYLIATQKYFDEVNSNPELLKNNPNKNFGNVADGNYGFRMYEILTGGEYTHWTMFDADSPKINNGIGLGTNESLTKTNIDDLYKMIESRNGAMTISIPAIEHNISVVGVNDNKFLIQDSSGMEKMLEYVLSEDGEMLFTSEKERIYGRETYSIPKEYLLDYQFIMNYIKWE